MVFLKSKLSISWSMSFGLKIPGNNPLYPFPLVTTSTLFMSMSRCLSSIYFNKAIFLGMLEFNGFNDLIDTVTQVIVISCPSKLLTKYTASR